MRNRYSIFLALVIGTIALLNSTAHARQPNVVFLLADDMRADTIAALGNSVIHTPNLDALSRGGATFTRAISSDPICTASRAEILTGCTSFRNGVMYFGEKFKPTTLPFWPEAMKNAGYQTWFVGKWHNSGLPSDHGYMEIKREIIGNCDHRMKFDDGKKPTTGFSSALLADAAIEFINRKSDRPFFLHVNFMAPHDPREIPAGYEGMYDPRVMPLPGNFLPRHPFDNGELWCRDEMLLAIPRRPALVQAEIAIYYTMISHLDAQIGRIISALRETNQLDNTIIVFTSDSGLALGSHGLLGKQNMYDHSVGVPLIFSGPGVPRDFKSDAQCTLRDLYPTVADLTGVTTPRGLQGESLQPILAGKAKTRSQNFVCGYYRNVQRMIRTDRWKLIHYPLLGSDQLFDLQNDPLEKCDLANSPGYREKIAELREKLLDWQRANGDPLVGPATALVESSSQ